MTCQAWAHMLKTLLNSLSEIGNSIQMGTNSNQKFCLLFWAEQMGIKLGSITFFCLVGLALFSFPESRNLEKLILHPSDSFVELRKKIRFDF